MYAHFIQTLIYNTGCYINAAKIYLQYKKYNRFCHLLKLHANAHEIKRHGFLKILQNSAPMKPRRHSTYSGYSLPIRTDSSDTINVTRVCHWDNFQQLWSSDMLLSLCSNLNSAIAKFYLRRYFAVEPLFTLHSNFKNSKVSL